MARMLSTGLTVLLTFASCSDSGFHDGGDGVEAAAEASQRVTTENDADADGPLGRHGAEDSFIQKGSVAPRQWRQDNLDPLPPAATHEADAKKGDDGSSETFDEGEDGRTGDESILGSGKGSKALPVRSMSAKLSYDGKVSFCVDFRAGEMTLGSLASRLPDSPLFVTFTVVTDGKSIDYSYESTRASEETTHELPGDWRKVRDASLSITAVRRDRGSLSPNYSTTKEGTKVCFFGDDQRRSQSGGLHLELDFGLEL